MKRLLVTGGTSGIGQAIAIGFAEAGWQVVAAGLEPPSLEQSAETQTGSEPTVAYQELDVTDAGAVDRLVGRFDRLDAVVNAAGIIRREEEFETDVFAQVLDVNLQGTMRVCVAARDKLAASKGSIVNIASMLTFFGGGVVPAYAASKGGVGQLTKSLAIAWAKDGVRVNALAPGWIETPLTAALRSDDERRNRIEERTPMKRWGKPEELVGPALFLTSDAASFVTGVIFPVDGGYSVQ